MNREIFNQDIAESAAGLISIIKSEYEKSESGKIKGHLILEGDKHVISRKEIRSFCIIRDEKDLEAHRGSVICREPNKKMRTLTATMVGYVVYLKLNEEFGSYDFKKFDLRLRTYQEYRYYQDRFWKYRRTKYEIPIFQVDIKW